MASLVGLRVCANFSYLVLKRPSGRQAARPTYLEGRERARSTEELEGLAHGCLHMDTLEVVPALLEKGGEEVDSHKNVLSELFLRHLLVADSNGHAGDLLELELDGSSSIIDLGSEVFVVSDDLGEHANSV